MIVAAGGGERDYAVDEAVLSALPESDNPDVLLNQRLMSDLRPTLFLAQLSNLLAGNISIVHGVIGSSRTFMGEEASGTDAVRIACARIAAGQGDVFLVGGSFNAQRPDILMLHELGGMLWKQDYAPVWARQQAGGGMVLGSLGCFLVLESRGARGGTGRERPGAHRCHLHRALPPRPGRGHRGGTPAARRHAAPSGGRRGGRHLRRFGGGSGHG